MSPSASACTRSTSPEPACSGPMAASPRLDMPHSATIRWARPVALAMSLEAPWVKSPSRRISSAARPARETARRARASAPVRKAASSPPIQVTPPAEPRGTIVTCTGSWASGSTSATTAWPDSCQAVISRSRSVTVAERRARPIITVASASEKSSVVSSSRSARAVSRAAWLTRLAMSAPVRPGIRRARATKSTSGAVFRSAV